ncbi:MAG: hypothetical protein J6Y20_06995 [Lachnospiraceae bacterium]|nr:hypothetical protein [Lachnospiraceae bacterium]
MGQHGVTDYYTDKFQSGLEYQDFIIDQLRRQKTCLIIQTYSSLKWQKSAGESSSGIEIKFDMLFHKTGNLYFEVAEKSSEDKPEFSPSGIMREDNSWLYLIGDYHEAFLFSKHQLRTVFENKDGYAARGIREKQTPTSVGITYPVENAMKGLCLKRFVFDGQERR